MLLSSKLLRSGGGGPFHPESEKTRRSVHIMKNGIEPELRTALMETGHLRGLVNWLDSLGNKEAHWLCFFILLHPAGEWMLPVLTIWVPLFLCHRFFWPQTYLSLDWVPLYSLVFFPHEVFIFSPAPV